MPTTHGRTSIDEPPPMVIQGTQPLPDRSGVSSQEAAEARERAIVEAQPRQILRGLELDEAYGATDGAITKQIARGQEMDAAAIETPSDATGTSIGSPSGASTTRPALVWEDVNGWDRLIVAAATEYGVPPERLKAMIALESNGKMYNEDGSLLTSHAGAIGLGQIMPSMHNGAATQEGYDIYTPEGNVYWAAKMMADSYQATGDWDLASDMYFSGDGVINGASDGLITDEQYVRMVNAFEAEILGQQAARPPNQGDTAPTEGVAVPSTLSPGRDPVSLTDI